MKSLSPLAFTLMGAALILGTLCTLVLADPPLPPPVPDLPSEVSRESDPTFTSGIPGAHVEVSVEAPALSPPVAESARGVYQRGTHFYRKRNGVEQVYSVECNGRSCKPGWYPVSEVFSVSFAPTYAQASKSSGCSGVASGCSGSSSRRVRSGRPRFFRSAGCGG